MPLGTVTMRAGPFWISGVLTSTKPPSTMRKVWSKMKCTPTSSRSGAPFSCAQPTWPGFTRTTLSGPTVMTLSLMLVQYWYSRLGEL